MLRDKLSIACLGGTAQAFLANQLHRPFESAILRIQRADLFHPGLSLFQFSALDRALDLLEIAAKPFLQFTGGARILRVLFESAPDCGERLFVIPAE